MVTHSELNQISHQHLFQKRTKFQKRPKRVSRDHQKNGLMVSKSLSNNLPVDEEYRAKMLDDLGGRDKHDYYFSSYSSFHIHEEMLKDTVRTRSYQRAI